MRNITLNVFVISGLLGFGGLYYYSGEVEDHYKANADRYLKASLEKISSWALSILNHPPKLSYSSNVRFEHGSAIMTATLTLENQHFKYYNLNLGKPASE